MNDYWQCLKCSSVFNHEDDACPECGSSDTEDIGDIKVHLKIKRIEFQALKKQVEELKDFERHYIELHEASELNGFMQRHLYKRAKNFLKD